MPSRVSAKVEFHVESADLRKLYLDLKGFEGNLQVELRRGLREAGEGMAAAVRNEASWSSRIPGATKVVPSFAARGAGVSIQVDARKAPEARPLEHGGRAGAFRHPVYASSTEDRSRWAWASEPARPFFYAAIGGRTPAVEQRMRQVMTDVAAKAGFTGT